jgi:hypothetical protein
MAARIADSCAVLNHWSALGLAPDRWDMAGPPRAVNLAAMDARASTTVPPVQVHEVWHLGFSFGLPWMIPLALVVVGAALFVSRRRHRSAP